MCRTYKTQGKRFCESHSIDTGDLEEAVLCSVKEEAKKILKPEDIDELKKMHVFSEAANDCEMQLDSIRERIKKIEKFKRKT